MASRFALHVDLSASDFIKENEIENNLENQVEHRFVSKITIEEKGKLKAVPRGSFTSKR